MNSHKIVFCDILLTNLDYIQTRRQTGAPEYIISHMSLAADTKITKWSLPAVSRSALFALVQCSYRPNSMRVGGQWRHGSLRTLSQHYLQNEQHVRPTPLRLKPNLVFPLVFAVSSLPAQIRFISAPPYHSLPLFMSCPWLATPIVSALLTSGPPSPSVANETWFASEWQST